VPNLIGYVRVILAIISFYFAFTHPIIFSFCYMTSFLLDAADGYAARSLNQCSRFGEVLDMATDRMATAGFVLILTHLPPYNEFTPRFLLILANALDLSSHWYKMFATLACNMGSHKTGSTFLTRVYYKHRSVLSLVCLGQEVFYFGLYVLAFLNPIADIIGADPILLGEAVRGLVYISAPVYAIKQIINVVQLGESCSSIVALGASR